MLLRIEDLTRGKIAWMSDPKEIPGHATLPKLKRQDLIIANSVLGNGEVEPQCRMARSRFLGGRRSRRCERDRSRCVSIFRTCSKPRRAPGVCGQSYASRGRRKPRQLP